jgi:hypothetical protein
MSTGSFESEIRDTWELSGLSIPAISFADHRVGDGFDGAILLPTPDGKFAGKGYRMIPVMEPKTIRDEKGKPVDNPNYGKPRRWRDGGLMTQTVLTLLVPGLSTIDFDGFVSAQAIEKFKAAIKSDDPSDTEFVGMIARFGLRRLYIQGGSLEPEFKTAVKNLTKLPQVGGAVSVRIAKMEPNEHGGRTKFYAVQYALPTTATLAAVEQYLSVGSTVVNDYLQIGSPASKASDTALAEHAQSEDEPPF